jgi:hypothetical protein
MSTKSDQELLELAAKAAGMPELRWCEVWNGMASPTPGGRFALTSWWNYLGTVVQQDGSEWHVYYQENQ